MAGSADALVLFIDNTESLYRGMKHAEGQLAKKKARGVYDAERAAQAFSYVVEEGARRYVKELGASEELPKSWHEAFPKTVREEAAKDLTRRFEQRWEHERAQYEKDLPKKYQGGKGVTVSKRVTGEARGTNALRTFSLKELTDLPTIQQGHTDNLKLDLGTTRIWLSRMTKADGAPYDNQVTVEQRDASGAWKTVRVYQAKAGGARKERSARHESGKNPRISGRGGKPPIARARLLGRRYNAIAWGQWNPGTPEPWNYPQPGDFESAEGELGLARGSLQNPETALDSQTADAFKEGFKEANDRARGKKVKAPIARKQSARRERYAVIEERLGAKAAKHESGKNPVMSPAEINEYLRDRRIDVSTFWQEAMGGDTAPMERSTMIRIVRSLGSGSAGRHERGKNPRVARQLPEGLHSAYTWIESAGEWNEALASPGRYAKQAAANFRTHADPSEWGAVGVSELLAAIEWERARRHERGDNPSLHAGSSRRGTRRPLGAPQSMMGTPPAKWKRHLGVPVAKPKKASAKGGAKRATKAAKHEGVVVSSGLRSRLDNILGKR